MPRVSSKGLTFLEVILITGILALVATIMIPRMLASNNSLSVDTYSKEVLNLLQTVQTQSKSIQRSLNVSININQANMITSISTDLPGHLKGTSITKKVSFPSNIIASSNAQITHLTFKPDRSWEAFKNTTALSLSTLSLSLESSSFSKHIILYEQSHSIQLIE
ncbi:hypothetical protein DID78_03955 [Candidatus Marinamargulisbacteria bacterium SCGC AG-343-D04]|nr:hypothetical protein DID78_03955 [Candidatus Marinamargulisbacteria bacterium SCGC AG-343-D04]